MAKASKVLIVDDDPELRDGLTEQLSLHEFEAVAAENGSKGVQAAKAGQIDGRGSAGHRRPRSGAHPAQERI